MSSSSYESGIAKLSKWSLSLQTCLSATWWSGDKCCVISSLSSSYLGNQGTIHSNPSCWYQPPSVCNLQYYTHTLLIARDRSNWNRKLYRCKAGLFKSFQCLKYQFLKIPSPALFGWGWHFCYHHTFQCPMGIGRGGYKKRNLLGIYSLQIW